MKLQTATAVTLALGSGNALADVTFYDNSDLAFVFSPFEPRVADGPGFNDPLLVQTTLYPLSFPDGNGVGMLSPTDFTAWVSAFNNNEPGCDQNSDGNCTPTDFTAWVSNFNAGC
ncbi:MAG: GC-type dockerin domain-anchored protein [Phycisphaerales bacterium JB061]